MVFVYAQSPFGNEDTVYCLDRLGIKYTVVNNLNDYLSISNDNKKLAILTESYRHLSQINKIRQNSTLIFFIDHELHNVINFKDHEYWSLPGLINFKNKSEHYSFNGHWFNITTELYSRLGTNKLSELTPYVVKPKYFDALLGSVKPHRNFIYKAIENLGLSTQMIVSYNPDAKFNPTNFYADDYFIWEPGTKPIESMTILDTTSRVTYFGEETHLSCILPLSVYNQSCYSIIAETNADNNFSFFTEKTAKPILARRLFVAFSGYGFLNNLKSLGFQTFDTIIDETYDLIVNPEMRFKKAFEQVLDLCKRPQEEILDLIKPITEHNYNLIQSMPWKEQNTVWMDTIIKNRLSDSVDM